MFAAHCLEYLTRRRMQNIKKILSRYTMKAMHELMNEQLDRGVHLDAEMRLAGITGGRFDIDQATGRRFVMLEFRNSSKERVFGVDKYERRR
jgi:hypothetical protein